MKYSLRTHDLCELAKQTLHDPCLRFDVQSIGDEGEHLVQLNARFTVRLDVPAGMPLDVYRQRLCEAYVTLANCARMHLKLHVQAVGPVSLEAEHDP